MSIATDCPDCCTCPTPTVEWDSRSATAQICGYPAFDWPTHQTVWATLSLTGYQEACEFNDTTCTTPRDSEREDYGGSVTYTSCTGPTTTGALTVTDSYSALSNCTIDTSNPPGTLPSVLPLQGWRVGEPNPSPDPATYTVTETTYQAVASRTCVAGVAVPTRSYEMECDYTNTLSAEVTCETVKTEAVSALPAWDDDWNDTAGSFSACTKGLASGVASVSAAIRESRYRIRFEVPLVRTGKLYRVSWVERFIAEAGVALTSVEVYSRGVYRPAVTLSAPPAGGTQAYAVAVMSSTGTVASIRILNPGSGYTSAPTVTLAAAINGGTTATATATINSDGQVDAISVTAPGDYLPTLAFSGGGGTGATATATMDDRGGISAVTLGAAGSGYTSAPTLTITPKVAGTTAADLLLHLGTETPRCAVWDGVEPGGYDPDDPTTYPIIGDGTNPYWSLPVPTADGTTLVANLRAVCDGTACP